MPGQSNHSWTQGTQFYFRFAWFQFQERFTDFWSSLGFLMLYPLFIWLLTRIWMHFNSTQGNYTPHEIPVYVAITELLFMTFLRSNFLQRSASDFSVALARPRSWIWLTWVGQLGTTLGGRLMYAGLGWITLIALGIPVDLTGIAFARLALLLPLLCIIEALGAGILLSARLLWHEVRYLTLPLLKIFLALGGVFGPLLDYGEPWRSILISLPPSDLFFQVGHFCLRGEFYAMSESTWVLRMLLWIGLAASANLIFFRYAKKQHQSWGG